VPLSGLVIFHPKGTGSMSILVWAMVCLGFSRPWSLEFISGATQTDSGHAAEYGMKTCGTMSAVQDVYQVRVNICITCTDSPMDCVQCSGCLGYLTPGRILLLSRYVPVSKRGAVPPILLLLHLQELRADLERQRRVLQNAAIIHARDQDELARISAASAPAVNEDPYPSTLRDIRTAKQDPSLCSSEDLERPPPSSKIYDLKHHDASRPSHSPELPPIGKDRDWQPEAWTPQTTRRQGG